MGCVTNTAFCSGINLSDIIHAKGWFIGASVCLVWPKLENNNTKVFNGHDTSEPYNTDLYSIDRAPGHTENGHWT